MPMKCEAIFAELGARADAELVKKVGCTYRFDVTAADMKKSFLVDLKNGNGSVKESSEKADCIIAISDDDYVALMSGKLNAQSAFMQGKIKIQGNMMLAMKLQNLTKPKASM